MTVKNSEFPFWNLTYNDPGRWREVEAISGKRFGIWKGMIQTLKGKPIGSTRTRLLSCSNHPSFEKLLGSSDTRRGLNFESTSDGVIAFFKVRLELYGTPIRRGEWDSSNFGDLSEKTQLPIKLTFRRGDQTLTFHIQADNHQCIQLKRWLHQNLTSEALIDSSGH